MVSWLYILRPTAAKTLSFVKYNIIIWPRGNVTLVSFLKYPRHFMSSQYCWHPWMSMAIPCVSVCFWFWEDIGCRFQRKIVQHMTDINIFIVYAQFIYSKLFCSQEQVVLIHTQLSINKLYIQLVLCSHMLNKHMKCLIHVALHAVDMNLQICW